MEILLIVVILIGLGIALFDIETATIPHTLTLALLVCGIVSCFADKDITIAVPLVTFFSLFGFLFLLFCIIGENAIGGGDVKIMSISMLFLHQLDEIIIYCVFLFILSLIGAVIARINKEKSIKYGPYMSLALVGTICFKITEGYSNAISIITSLGFLIILLDALWFTERKMIKNVEENFFMYKK